MGWLAELKRDNDAKHDVFQLRHNLDEVADAYRAQTKGLKSNSDEYQRALAVYANESGLIVAQIKQIETERILNRAGRWSVPVPDRPLQQSDDNEFWAWHTVHGRHYLTDVGMSKLRREIYQEWEMWSKPSLTYIALVFSVISLAISVMKS